MSCVAVMPEPQNSMQKFRIFLSTSRQICINFAYRGRFFLWPLAVVLLLGTIFLVVVNIIPMSAPFVYALF